MTLVAIAFLIAGACVSFADRGTLIHLFPGVALLGVGYAQIRPAQPKRAVEFYEAKALDALGS